MGVAGRRRALDRFSWRAVAEATAAAYARAVEAQHSTAPLEETDADR
jgi:hypothetical protein